MKRQFHVVLVVAVPVVFAAGATAARADWKDDVGYTSLKNRLGSSKPTGAAIPVTQVEGTETGGKYLPNASNGEFLNPSKSFTDRTGSNPNPSGHGTTVGQYFYGNTLSMAPGVMNIDVYEANHWVGAGAALWWSQLAPKRERQRAQNHSYIDDPPVGDLDARDLLRRVDLLVQRDGVVVAAGVNNGAGKPMPKIQGSAYNILAVGLTNGASSYGPTLVDIPGRVKPDIVAPLGATSWATPVVASAAALLLETMQTEQSLAYLVPDYRRPAEAMLTKALLMDGATKTEWTNWRKGFATPSTDGTVPLDYRYGAGELNIDNSHRILTAGQHEACDDEDVPTTGWDYDIIRASQPRTFFFEVPAGQVARYVSILVTWHRRIAFLVPADLDADGDVDETDHAIFESCATAPAAGPVSGPCEDADFDGDNDVDQSDFGLFQVCLSGHALPPPPTCPGTTDPATINASLANINLYLYAATGFNQGALIDRSISAIDNVEHLFLRNVAAGRYVFELTTNTDWDYAVAWDALTAPATLGQPSPEGADAGESLPGEPLPIPTITLDHDRAK